MRVLVEIRGVSPMLMNAATEELLEGIRTKTTKPKVRDQSREAEAGPKVYSDPVTGQVGIPTMNLYSCLVEAGRQVSSGKGVTKISTATSTLLPSMVLIDEVFLPFTDCSEWVADMRRGRNPNGGEMVAIVRPRFDRWVFAVTLVIDENRINPDRIRELVTVAGSSIGLCDYRPSKRGLFGRFVVASWTVLDVPATKDGRRRSKAPLKVS